VSICSVSWKPLSSSFAAMANLRGLIFLILRFSRKLFAARISALATFLMEDLLISPCPARPVSCFCFWSRIVAVVARSEVAPAAFLVFLDSHVWVAECYTLDLVAILDVHHRLLFAVARLTLADPARLVQ